MTDTQRNAGVVIGVNAHVFCGDARLAWFHPPLEVCAFHCHRSSWRVICDERIDANTPRLAKMTLVQQAGQMPYFTISIMAFIVILIAGQPRRRITKEFQY